jgi:hypothetical protein
LNRIDAFCKSSKQIERWLSLKVTKTTNLDQTDRKPQK